MLLFIGILASIAYIIMSHMAQNGQIENHRDTIFIIVLLVVGIIGGLLAMFLWKVGLFFLGAIGGGYLALLILSLGTSGVIHSEAGRYVFIALMAIAGGIAALFLQRHVVIISTSIVGSLSFFFGVDVFAKTGLAYYVDEIVSGVSVPSGGNGKIYGMLAGVIILALIGIVHQYRTYRNHRWSH